MSAARGFFDTNILVYCFDEREPAKREVASTLVLDLCALGRGVISFQVQSEFANVAIRRIKDKEEVRRRIQGLDHLLLGIHLVSSSSPMFRNAVRLWDRYGLAWYDSLIVAAALEGRCEVLFSEDLQHGLEIDGMRIVNPFL